MVNPYDGLPARAFWRTGVADPAPHLPGLYRKAFDIAPGDRIATAGSCFAQHVGRHLRRHGFDVIDAERAPADLPPARHAAFGYGLFSARHGNIYTAQQLLHLAREALGEAAHGPVAWERDGRWFDAFRPGVDPDGLPSAADVASRRAVHLGRVREVLLGMDVLVFTLGLTEHWALKGTDVVFPMAPGTVAGTFDPALHEFRDAGVADVVRDMTAVLALLARHRGAAAPPLRTVLSVSPVPLAATASGAHVLAASTHAKAVLRVAAGELCRTLPSVDYFPAFEIVTNPAARGAYRADDGRTVREAGIAAVMDAFLAEHAAGAPPPGAAAAGADDREACEEAILDAFGPGEPAPAPAR